MWTELEETLCDLRFIDAKCSEGVTYDLIRYFNRALDVLQENAEGESSKYEVKAFSKFVALKAIIWSNSQIYLVFVFNRLTTP
jgi:hypothetical protein